jgi:hypothetical protein
MERYEERQKKVKELNEIHNRIVVTKRVIVSQTRDEREQNENMKRTFKMQQVSMNQEKKKRVIDNYENGKIKLQRFKISKFASFKNFHSNRLVSEKDEVIDREMQAQTLETIEAELLKKLQLTQNMERQAFSELESAMIDSSMPKRKRFETFQSNGD